MTQLSQAKKVYDSAKKRKSKAIEMRKKAEKICIASGKDCQKKLRQLKKIEADLKK